MIKKCLGCGAIIQSTDPLKPGYVKALVADLDEVFCTRCYRMKHYNEMPKIVASNKDYETVIDAVLKKNGLMVLIVDLFDFQGSFITKMINKLRGQDVVIVANKFDIFPKSTNPRKIVDWISKSCEKVFFKVLAIHLVSAKKGYFLDDFMNSVDMFRRGRDVYFVGVANVGKSSLINSVIKRFTSKTDDVIATSPIPGTTLNSITIPFFEDNKAFIDTPGLINEANILNNLLPESNKVILPKGEIKPITYQLKEGNAICVGGLAIIMIQKGDTNVNCYFSNMINLHRTKSERAMELIETSLGRVLTPPKEEELPIEYDTKIFDFNGTKKDLVFSGLGFFTISKPCQIKAMYIKNTGVFTRNAIISGKSN